MSGHIRCREYFGRREILIMVLAFIATALTNLISLRLPVELEPYLALCPVIGLLFGPLGIIGVNLVSFLYNTWMGYPFDLVILDLLNVFMVSYIPYRLWYSIGMDRDARPPVFDSVFNVTKFMVVMTVTSLVYTLLYNILYTYLEGSMVLDIEDLARFLKVVSFSFLFGMSAALILKYLGVRFETPRFGGTPEGIRRRIDSRWFDVCLAVGAVVPAALMCTNPSNSVFTVLAVIEYGMLLVFLLKPVDPARADEKTVQIGRGLRINKFDRNLIERFIAMFVVIGLVICVGVGIVSYYVFFDSMSAEELSHSVVLYMSVALLAFFIPSVLILWYIESRVTVPVGAISEASRNFVSRDYDESASDFAATCARFSDAENEIGYLARSLSKMNDDMGTYIEDIRNLNSQQEKYRAELNVAKNIQESFVPRDFSVVDGTGAAIAGSMEAAKYVGGDFYDFFMVDDDHLAIAIGDVSGKGVPAALFMAVTKYLIEGQTHPGRGPASVLASANISLCRNNEENMFVTVWLGMLELSTGRLTYCSAGHNPPVIARENSEPDLLRSKTALVLGAREKAKYVPSEIVLSPGDRLLLYTDGITEANDCYEGFYGTDRLMAVVGRSGDLNLEDQIKAISDDVSAFTNGAEQFDDMTMLLLRYDGKPVA